MIVQQFDDVSHLIPAVWRGATVAPHKVYRSRCNRWVVQVFHQGDWLRVGIRKGGGNDEEITESWSFIQRIKEQLFPGRTAIEFYPKPEDVIDDAPMRWLFIAPAGFEFPVGLGDKVTA